MSGARRSLSLLLLGLRGTIALLSLCAVGGSPALAELFGDIEVTAEPQPAAEGGSPEIPLGGYIEHRLVVRNYSKTTDHTVRLIQPARGFGYANFGDYLERSARTVQAPHGARLVVSLFQPAIAVYGDNLAVEIDGARQKEMVYLAPSAGGGAGGFRYGAPSELLVLASRGVPQELKDAVTAAHANSVVFCRSELVTGQWSPNWLGYTGYDVVLMTDAEAATLPADVQLALRRYVEIGGIFLVRPSSPDAKDIVPDALRDPGAMPREDGLLPVGFGLVGPCPAAPPWPIGFWVTRSREAVAPGDREAQIVGEINVPVRGLLMLVIVFAIGIGPINVWWLSRRRKRMWLWWNVPAVSLATCLAVFGYSMFSEGFRGHGRTAVITLLDENAHRATSLGYVSYYCPLTPSDGLRFSYDTTVAHLHSGAAFVFGQGGGRAKTLDWTTDQHLDSGWIVARVPACFAVRKNETRRERLTVHRAADGKLKVVNGLGVTIDSLVYRDESGALGFASELSPGAERVLDARDSSGKKLPGGETLPDRPEPLRTVFEQPWNTSMRGLRGFPEKYLAPGCYMAVVKQSPFLEDPLPAAPQEGSFGIIYGVGARAGDGR